MTGKRQLLAIVFTDIVNYTSMMGESEQNALAVLQRSRELHRRAVEHYHGELIEEVGDGTLASFVSAVDAVDYALALQRSLVGDRVLKLRIGIHSGDVVLREGKLFGDSVNVASRIVLMASPGGVCVSRNVYESVRNRTGVDGVLLGGRAFKDMADPVRVYGLVAEGLAPPSPQHETKAMSSKQGGSHRVLWVAAAVLLCAAGVWYDSSRRALSPPETASEGRMAFPLPEKPSIAVLPFDNLSSDPAQEYFSDGLTEDIITGLSKVPDLFVIARNSSFTYKGKPVKVQQVSEELGVRYVLEGSVRRDGDRLRISAQLNDAIRGHHLWADRYDRDLQDVFTLLDEITMEIMVSLQVTLTGGDRARVFRRGTENLEAYQKFLQARHYDRAFNKEANIRAQDLYEKVIELDPEYPAAFTCLAGTHCREVMLGSSRNRKRSMKTGMDLARKAISLDGSYAYAHGQLGWILLMAGRHDEAIGEAETAVSLNPNSSESLAWLGFILNYAGEREDALTLLERAIRIDPFPTPRMLLMMGIAYRDAERLDDAIATCRKIVERQPDYIFGHTCLASAYSLSNMMKEAHDEAAEVIRIDPDFTLETSSSMPYRNPQDRDRLVTSLRNAGLE